MFNIDKFLEKFSKKIQSDDLYIKKIVEVIKKYTNIDIPKDNLEIKDCVIHTKSSPAVKNQIFIYKEKILKEINSITKVKIVDIN